ncbi:unnamed protein product [Closterium sp. NIES-54]
MAKLTALLTNLLRKGVEYTWGEKEQAAFSALKNILCSPPVLCIADPHRPFKLVTDASDIAVGEVLLQDFENDLQPIAYESRKLHPPERNYPIYDCEMLAIVHAFKRRLRRLVYGLRQAPREWHDTLRSTLSDLRFQPSSADPSLFVRRGSTPLFVLVYVDNLVFATADRVALANVKSELKNRHACTDLGELRHYLGLQITRDRAARTITLSLSHMVQHVLQRFELQHSTVQCTPLAIDHRITGIFPDEPFELSGPYAELVGCLMFTRSSFVSTSTAKAEIYAGAMAA